MKKLQFLKVGGYMKTITRAKYLDRIIELKGTPDIKIITGIRRSGKSKLMQAYIAYLKSNFENINIIFIDFMDLAYEEIKEIQKTPEDLRNALLGTYANFLEDKITGNDREIGRAHV